MIKKILTMVFLFLITAIPAIASDCNYVKARHILVDNESDAIQIKKELDEGADFAYYAKVYSKCPSGKQGGELGYFRRGDMVKAFENSAFNLNVGEISEPVRTQFGWHIIQVEDKK